MPILSIAVNQNPSPEQAARLLDAASQAVVRSVGAPIASVRVSLQTTGQQNTMVAGVQGHPLALVHVYMLPGRTEDQREALISQLSAAVETSLAMSSQDIRVILHDVALTDMGMGGGISAKKAGR